VYLSHPGIRAYLPLLALCLVAALITPATAITIGSARSTEAHWVTGGPWGDDLGDIAVSPANPSRLFAVSYFHVYRSDDGARSWKTTSGTSSYEPTLAVSGQDPDVVYTSNRDQVQTSIDAGVTWTDITPDFSGTIGDVAVDPTNDDIAYVGTTPVYKTTDGGTTWAPTGLASGGLLTIDPVSPSTVFAASDGVYRSKDGGASWIRLDNGLPHGEPPEAIAVDPNNHQRVLVTIDGHIYRSHDGGDSWVLSDAGLSGAPVYSLSESPADPNTVYAATAAWPPPAPTKPAGFFRSEDGGVHWKPLSTAVAANVLTVDPTSVGVVYAVGDPVGVLKSLDSGVHWKQTSRGMLQTYVEAVAADPTNPSVAYASIGSISGLFKTLDGGRTWQWTSQGLVRHPISLAVAPSDPRIVYAGVTDYGWYGTFADAGVFVSLDGGLHWRRANAGIDDVEINGLAVDPADPFVVYAAGGNFCDTFCHGHVWKSTDGGATWTELSNGLEDDAYLALAMSTSEPQVLYAANPNIFRTVNGGQSWIEADNGINGTAGLNALAVDPTDPYVVYASLFSRGVYRTTDGGLHWSRLPSSPARATDLYADPTTPGSLCAGTETDVQCSTDYGDTWTPVPGLQRKTTSLVIGQAKALFVGTTGHGVAAYHP
jgi:photosystem II stability/assembly factor-like uncharacterized protein